ncbi:MAG: hypothetical protein HC820_02860 [Hydrococcus sp. RM1_1_31]|nr:hypothetical protein [Hydrococcus sp. RM1_1_31]
MQYIFSADGTCKWYYLAPNDKHHFRDGTWKIDANTENIIHIEQDKTVSYRIVELTKEVLRMVLTTTKTTVFEVQDLGISQESLTASGTVNTAGWKDAELIPRPPSSGGKLEFDFVAQPPDGSVAQVITPIKAMYRLSQEERNNNHFIVYASHNKKGIFLE